MPTSETFSHFFNLGSSLPTANSVYPNISASTGELRDTIDGSGDGITVVGSFTRWIFGSNAQTVEIVGLHNGGEPVLLFFGTYYALTNDPNLASNSSMNFQNTGSYVYCFGVGTQISTPSGICAVETLEIGQNIITADGRTTPVTWIGHQTHRKLFSGHRMQPVLIRAGALGGGLPYSDLTVTGDHGMMIDGYVINASALVNGGTIDWASYSDMPDRVTYYHVETENHDVILANGAPSETYVDIPSRAAFDNYQEYLDLYGEERMVPEMANYRITTQRLLPDAIKARLGITPKVIDLAISA